MNWRCTLILLVTIAAPLHAAELREIAVGHKKGVYTMKSVVWFDAPIDNTYAIFRSWDYSKDFSSAIVEARDVEPDEQGRPQYYSRMKGCVLFFCREFVRQGYAEVVPNEVLRAFANPDVSDFEFVNEVWTFTEEDSGTIVVYELAMDPKFWIPPAIGPYFIKRKLKQDGGQAIDRIEKIAQGLADE
ncbi:MAG: hypothetical protein AAFN50_04795 [Pseudomonadota bacterium]